MKKSKKYGIELANNGEFEYTIHIPNQPFLPEELGKIIIKEQDDVVKTSSHITIYYNDSCGKSTKWISISNNDSNPDSIIVPHDFMYEMIEVVDEIIYHRWEFVTCIDKSWCLHVTVKNVKYDEHGEYNESTYSSYNMLDIKYLHSFMHKYVKSFGIPRIGTYIDIMKHDVLTVREIKMVEGHPELDSIHIILDSNYLDAETTALHPDVLANKIASRLT